MKKLVTIISVFFIGLTLLALPVNAEAAGETVDVTVTATFDSTNADISFPIVGATYGSEIKPDFTSQTMPTGYEFAFWIIDGTIDHGLAENASFTVTNNLSVTAVYHPTGQHAVVFVDHNGSVIETKYVAAGTVSEPDNLPDKVGYDYATPKWTSLAGDADLTTITDNTVFKLNYERQTNVQDVTITVDDSQTTHRYNDLVTVTSDLVGFTHWEEDGKVVSYNKDYTFSALYNRSLTPATGGVVEPLITISKDLQLRTDYISKVAQVELPSSYELLEYGYLVSKNPGKLDTTNSTLVKSVSINNSNEFLTSITNTYTNVDAYAIIKDNTGVILTIYTKGVDLTAYDNALASASQLVEADYSDTSWQNLQDTILNNQMTVSNTQTEINDAVAAINTAVTNLVKVRVYEVTFTGVDINIDPLQVIENGLVEVETPVREGFEFLGWFYNDNPWNLLADEVNEDITLVAKWEEKIVYTTIAEALAAPIGTEMIVRGILISRESNDNFYIQDSTGTIRIYQGGSNSSLQNQIGKEVIVVGKRAEYRDVQQITHTSFEVKELSDDFAVLYNFTKAPELTLTIEEPKNIVLSFDTTNDVTISWTSSHPNIISDQGVVILPNEQTVVTLTLTISKNAEVMDKVYEITVHKMPVMFNVHFNSNGGSAVESVLALENKTFEKPVDPTHENLFFAGWFKDEALEVAWNFETDVVTQEMTLYAKWQEETNLVSTTTIFSYADTNMTGSYQNNQFIFETIEYAYNRAGTFDNGKTMQFNGSWLKNNTDMGEIQEIVITFSNDGNASDLKVHAGNSTSATSITPNISGKVRSFDLSSNPTGFFYINASKYVTITSIEVTYLS